MDSFTLTAIASTTNLGDQATFKCETVIENTDRPINLQIRADSVTYLYYQYGNPDNLISSPSEADPRYGYDKANQTMTISNVSCQDEKRTECVVTGFFESQISTTTRTSSATIYVKGIHLFHC